MKSWPCFGNFDDLFSVLLVSRTQLKMISDFDGSFEVEVVSRKNVWCLGISMMDFICEVRCEDFGKGICRVMLRSPGRRWSRSMFHPVKVAKVNVLLRDNWQNHGKEDSLDPMILIPGFLNLDPVSCVLLRNGAIIDGQAKEFSTVLRLFFFFWHEGW